MYQPLLRPSPGRQEESPGQVVAQRWFRCGLTCPQARLDFVSTIQRICAGAAAAPAANRHASNTVERLMSSVTTSRVHAAARPLGAEHEVEAHEEVMPDVGIHAETQVVELR